MRSISSRLPKQLEPDLMHRWSSNGICYDRRCFEHSVQMYGCVLFVADGQGRHGIVCDPCAVGLREGH